MDLTHTLDFLVVGALALLSLGLVGLAMAAGQLVPQVNRTLTAYEKLATTLETELAPTLQEVSKLAGGVIKIQSVAQHSIAEVGTKVEDVTGNLTKVTSSATKESNVWGTGLLAGFKAYLSSQHKDDLHSETSASGKGTDNSRNKNKDKRQLTMDRGEENVGLKR
ncbi:MAG: hypothetical protein IT342_22685 [Candidatus Melainabacteria bacterium]|nr:hypothetical protein [Candidatus Melainabacteria bacterium]